MSVRLRRLKADYEQIREGLRDHPAIAIRGVEGNPPERYQIEFKVRSLSEAADGTVKERHEHVAEFFLTLSYPRLAPQCRMLTPVFHPNIAPHAVCIGDHWAAGESLLQLIVRVGEMLAFQSYNVKSPLNGAAARWVEENQDRLPTDSRDLTPAIWASAAGARLHAEGRCQNCAAAGAELARCANGHLVCPGCTVICSRCGGRFCVLCKLETCSECARLVCAGCRSACPACGRTVCSAHLKSCAMCGASGCHDCAIECSACCRTVCLRHVGQCSSCKSPLCPDHARPCPICGRKFCASHFDSARGACTGCAVEPRTPQPPAPVIIGCAACGARLKVQPADLGKRGKCPRCGAVLVAGQS